MLQTWSLSQQHPSVQFIQRPYGCLHVLGVLVVAVLVKQSYYLGSIGSPEFWKLPEYS